MVRFQPPSLLGEEEEEMDFTSSGSEAEEQTQRRTDNKQQQQQRHRANMGSDSSEDDEDDDIALPLKSRTPASVAPRFRNRMHTEDFEEEQEAGEGAGEQRHLRFMEDEEALAAEEEEEEREDGSLPPRVHLPHGQFVPEPPAAPRTLPRAAPPKPLTRFLSSLPYSTRPNHALDYHPDNMLAPAAAAAASIPTSRSMLEFHRHSFRAGWSSTGGMIVFPQGLDGRVVQLASVDALAIDANATRAQGELPEVTLSQREAEARRQERASKRQFITTCLETHLKFHSQTTSAASATAAATERGELKSTDRLFGADPNASTFSLVSTSSSSALSFGAPSFGALQPFSSSSSSSHLTPFTRLCDAYITSIKAQLASHVSPFTSSSSPSPSSSSSVTSELELALPTFQLLRTLYSQEEAEQRAPKLSRSMEQQLRQQLGAGAAGSEDLSVSTAKEDEYALYVGRESAFEHGWLKPTVNSTYVTPRIRQLQQHSGSSVSGGDGVTGTKLQQVLTYLIGHDLQRATEVCLEMGNFRLATLVSQLGSFNYSGRVLGEGEGEGNASSDGRPLLESTSSDLARQLSTWLKKDRGMGEFIPQEMLRLYRLMSGDVLHVEPSLGWMESLGMHYWYMQPKATQTNIRAALLNYKKHAFMERTERVRKPFPPYASYVPVSERRGGSVAASGANDRGVLEDDEEDEDEMSDSNQALVVGSSSAASASAPSLREYYDLRFGLLELYTAQPRSLKSVLSPQTHTPHVLDHQLAWHLFTTLQLTSAETLSEFGPSLPAFYSSYIHQIELLAAEEGEENSSSDLWKWAVYLTLASPFPDGHAEFDREKIVKHILLKHVSFDKQKPFALHETANATTASSLFTPVASLLPSTASPSSASISSLPKSLPILRTDSSNIYSLTLIQDQSHSAQVEAASSSLSAPAWGSALSSLSSSSSSLSTDATELFLLQRLHLPVSWLYECKAIRAEYEHEYSIACFYQLHAGHIVQAYRLFHSHLLNGWLLAVINQQEARGDEETALETSLFALLHLFYPHREQLHGWAAHGGLVLSFLELRRNFRPNLAHFTSTEDKHTRARNFQAYQSELRELLQSMDALKEDASVSGVTLEAGLTRLSFSQMSGSVLNLLHALQPLFEELGGAGEQMEDGPSAAAAAQSSLELSTNELVSASDRLALLNDFKDSWLKQFSAQTNETH